MRRLLVLPAGLVAALAVLVSLLGAFVPTTATAAAGAGTPVPVLGSSDHLAPIGTGWGSVRPDSFSNGGDPAGSVSDLSWRYWGQRQTFARGSTWIFRPGGGYYGRPAAILLRAQDPGRCIDGSYGYRHLWFRVAHRPGGPLSRHWHRWGGDLCRRW